ncbi:hypothetical protein CsatB_002225 [Cannabis sativa]|uniref:uncharacterized protein LOC115697824 n=1 Tax=Cannabis sativa TaxID=3483 RepID=UPI0029C9DFC1|nr:uncharacterized protein LOC115697824 [Cannabis sativa]
MSSINITSPPQSHHCRCRCGNSNNNYGVWNNYLHIKGKRLLLHSYSYPLLYGSNNTNSNCKPIFSTTTTTTRCALDNTIFPDEDDNEDENENDSQKQKDDDAKNYNGPQETSSRRIRDNLERIVGKDDSGFSGIDLATLIRNKYGRSYDVQLIKKEFMGRNLLAMNVMWKYMEQRSFPLTEEEYILRLDDVANTLKCWGAVSHIRNSLQKSKERPRIGKAVSIFIDMDETGGRANEWIYK